MHTLSRRDVKHFKYTHINYPTQQTCNNNKLLIIQTTLIISNQTTKIAYKNNRRNRRRAAFYGINKFDYEVRENLMKGYPLLKETPTEEEKDKKVESSLGNEWTEA